MKEIKYNKFKEKIYYEECENGLGIYMWVNEKTSNYYATLNVKYGSIHTKFKLKDNKEYKVPNGIAHFLEHINFNEEDDKSAHDYFIKNGSSTNAFTTYEYTSYEVYGSSNIKGDITHLLDFVQTKNITEEIVEKEKGIIIEELKMGETDHGHQLYQATQTAVYKNNNRKHKIVGEEKEIRSITVNDLNLVFDNFYNPQNMFIIITGNFNPYEIAALIKENQAKKKFKESALKKIIDIDEVMEVVKENTIIYSNIEIPKLAIVYKIPRNKFKNYSNLLLRIYLRVIMNANFGSTSNLKEDLMEKELITYLSCNASTEANIITLSINCETKYPEELKKILTESMEKLSITEERLQRRVKCNIASTIVGFDDIEYMNSKIQSELIYDKKVHNNINEIYKLININDANAILKQINTKNCATILMLPEEKKA